MIDLRPHIRPGDLVVITPGAGEPTALTEALIAQRHDIGTFRVFTGSAYASLFKPEHADVITFVGLGAVGTNRALVQAGVMDILPIHYSEVPRTLSQGPLKADVALVQLGREISRRYSYGAAMGYMPSAVAAARTVIGEINAAAPRTFGGPDFVADDLAAVFETDRALPAVAEGEPGLIEKAIAARAAAYIEDGAILQMGIGKIPVAVLATLTDRRGLGLHTGVVGDGLVDLIEAGALTGDSHPMHPGRAVTGSLLGSERLYRFADNNRALAMAPVTETHDHLVLASLPKLIAINSALEADLTGQVSAEVADGAYIGTVGGQVDFVRGAMASPGGRSIIAFPSRTNRGVSRIVPAIASGIVTTGRAEADLIITEHGAAELRGVGLAERTRRMIAIAHPDDREGLERAARTVVAGT
ncbi:MAG: acetyl-CoA hydrolase/transferase C-terminal domain-containing protein [Caulobacteraceae bacterium]